MEKDVLLVSVFDLKQVREGLAEEAVVLPLTRYRRSLWCANWKAKILVFLSFTPLLSTRLLSRVLQARSCLMKIQIVVDFSLNAELVRS
jgi:hypothetical protein